MAKTKAKAKPKSKKRVADELVEKDPPNANEATDLYLSLVSLSTEQRSSVCLLLKKLDPSCFVATGDVIGEYATHCIDLTNISLETISKVKVMIDGFNVSTKIDEDDGNKKLPAKEPETFGNDNEEMAAKSNDEDEDYTPPSEDDKGDFLTHRDGEKNHSRLLAIMTEDIAASLDTMGIGSFTEIESSLVSSHNNLKESSNIGTSRSYRGSLGGYTREDNGERVSRADMGGDNTVLPDPTDGSLLGCDNTIRPVQLGVLVPVPSARAAVIDEHARVIGLMARDLQDICKDSNSLPIATSFGPAFTTILGNLNTSKGSTTRTNLGNYMRETEAQQLYEYRSQNGSAAIGEYILSLYCIVKTELRLNQIKSQLLKTI